MREFKNDIDEQDVYESIPPLVVGFNFARVLINCNVDNYKELDIKDKSNKKLTLMALKLGMKDFEYIPKSLLADDDFVKKSNGNRY